MAENGGSSGVNALAIIAILVLVGLAAWFFLGRQGTNDGDMDVNVKMDSSAIEAPYRAVA
jgi:hypothetical protein